jgi:hypothetical protein
MCTVLRPPLFLYDTQSLSFYPNSDTLTQINLLNLRYL